VSAISSTYNPRPQPLPPREGSPLSAFIAVSSLSWIWATARNHSPALYGVIKNDLSERDLRK